MAGTDAVEFQLYFAEKEVHHADMNKDAATSRSRRGVCTILVCFASALMMLCIEQITPPSVQAREIDNSALQQDEKSITAKCEAADLIFVGKLHEQMGGRLSSYYCDDIEVLYGKVAPGKRPAVLLRPYLLLLKPDDDAKWICFLAPARPVDQTANPKLEWRYVIGGVWDTNGVVAATPENLALVKRWISKKQSSEAEKKTTK
jgi:hypothetical protein